MQLPTVKLPKMKWQIKDIQLFRSDTGADGSKYTPLVCIPL